MIIKHKLYNNNNIKLEIIVEVDCLEVSLDYLEEKLTIENDTHICI